MKSTISIFTFVTVLLFSGLAIADGNLGVAPPTGKTSTGIGVDVPGTIVNNEDVLIDPKIPAGPSTHFDAETIRNRINPGDIRDGATISGVRGTFKCGLSYVDNMLIECTGKCGQEYYTNEVQHEICFNGCNIAHTILANIHN